MKLKIYKNQHEVEKVYEVDAYDIMYGTVEDVFDVLEGMENTKSDGDIIKLISDNRSKLNDLLLDIFGDQGLTKEELRKVKIKELVKVFIELFTYVTTSFKSKN